MAASPERFLKSLRLNKPSEFQKVFKTRLRSSDSRFLVLASENGLDHPRLGLAVSKDKLRKAVTRNTVKRIIRESFRKNIALLAGLDLVVLPQRHLNPDDRQALHDSLGLHWRKVSRCKNFC